MKNKEKKVFLFLVTEEGDFEKKFKIDLTEKEADVLILGIIIARKKSKIKIETVQNHKIGNTKSFLFFKSVLFDESSLDIKGNIGIAENAGKSDAFWKNNNLLLSSKAKVKSQPVLEIKSSDVKCSHAVTVSNLSKDQLYYLQTRGLSEQKAKAVLVEGFFEEIIEKAPDLSMQKELREKITKILSEYV